MRQVARRLRDGRLELVEVADASPGSGAVAVRVERSVISAGTERATLEVARKGLLAKARARPDQARQVLERARSEGVRSTLELVRQRLDELGPLGYSAAGTALEVGAEVAGIDAGRRVAIAGGGFANHAELDLVPALLCAPVPDRVTTEDAAFATLGAIAMHGFRRAEITLGSTVAVIGLGLIGQLAVRIARAAGCRVIGIDLDQGLVELARAAGADADLRAAVGDGEALAGAADAVLLTASAPNSDDPVRLAAALARDRAPVVAVGDLSLDLPRRPYYDKELDLRLSRSYGPGRYDPAYELHGHDYPIGYVRWTERRNMEAFLALVADGSVAPAELITHRYPFAAAERAFAELSAEPPPIAIVLEYEPVEAGRAGVAAEPAARVPEPTAARPRKAPRFGLIGAGSFATGTLIPGLLAEGFEPALVVSASGLSAEGARRRFGFESALGEPDAVLARDDIDLVVIATRHDSHAALTAAALRAGRAVYVEKPLALDERQLSAVRAAQLATGAGLFVGFNRRYAPLSEELRALPGPKLMGYRVNAGRVGADHWTNDLALGGGRLLGEGCHFIDFLCDQAGADPLTVSARGYRSTPGLPLRASDNFSLQIQFADGSVGTLGYSSDAPTGPGKERFETSSPGAYGVIDDFRRGAIWSGGRKRRLGSRTTDKGHSRQFRLLADVLAGRKPAPDPDSYLLSSLLTLCAARALESGKVETVLESDRPQSGPES